MKANKPIDGVLILDKPAKVTSNGALQQVKRLYRAQKAGHSGSLDPLATGVLPVCFGQATKFARFLLDADKTYIVTAELGVVTASGDADGEIIKKVPVPVLTQDRLEAVLAGFLGIIEQVPSMYSALKHQGQPLYKLARQGIVVERKPRKVNVYEIDLLRWQSPTFTLQVRVSKGTYVRTLVEDIGSALGTGAYVKGLRRVQAGPYALHQSVTVSTLTAVSEQQGLDGLMGYLLPVDSTVSDWPEVVLAQSASRSLSQGQSIKLSLPVKEGWVRVVEADSRFLGVGEVLGNGHLVPRRLVSQAQTETEPVEVL